MGNKQSQNEDSIYDRRLSLTAFESLRMSYQFKDMRNQEVPVHLQNHKQYANENIKILLTHPTVVEHFRDYCSSIGSDRLLDLYLSIVEIRQLYKANSIKESIKKFNRLGKSKGKLDHPKVTSFKPISYSPNMDMEPLRGVMDRMRIIQYEILFTLKEKHWINFVESNQYRHMLQHKELRVHLDLKESGALFEDAIASIRLSMESTKSSRISVSTASRSSDSFDFDNNIANLVNSSHISDGETCAVSLSYYS